MPPRHLVVVSSLGCVLAAQSVSTSLAAPTALPCTVNVGGQITTQSQPAGPLPNSGQVTNGLTSSGGTEFASIGWTSWAARAKPGSTCRSAPT